MLYQYSEDAPKFLSDVLIYEVNKVYSRDAAIVAPHDDDYPLGTVMALDNGKYKALAPGMTDVAKIAVLLSAQPASTADVECGLLVRAAVVAASGIAWDSGLVANDKTTALALLEAKGVVVR